MADDESKSIEVFDEVPRHESPEPVAEEQIKCKLVDLKTGLYELNLALGEGNMDNIREAYNNLTFTFPTAVNDNYQDILYFIKF